MSFAVGEKTRGRSLTSVRPRLGVVAVLLLAPFLGVLVLRAPLMNSFVYPDPWFYSSYGWALTHDINVFGWFYYAVRFPATLPVRWDTELFGPVAGYLILRYVLLVCVDGALFVVVRKCTGKLTALASVLLLVMTPFYLRSALWDYTTFISLPLTFATVAAWHLGSTPRARLASALGAGALLALVMFGNPSAWFVIPALGAVELIEALRAGRSGVVTLILRGIAALVGAAVVFVIGWLVYVAILGYIPPSQMIAPTLDFVTQFNALAGAFLLPAREWLLHDPQIFAPVLVCLAIVVVYGRDLLQRTIEARLVQFALLYTVIIWLTRKLTAEAVIETWWFYYLTAVTIGFALPLILSKVGGRTGRLKSTLAAALLGVAVTDVVVRSWSSPSVSVYHYIGRHVWLLLLVLGIGVVLTFALRVSGRPAWVAAFAVMITGLSLAPAFHITINTPGEFSPVGTKIELRTYKASYQLIRFLSQTDTPDHRTVLWTDLAGAAVASWVDLPNQQGMIGAVGGNPPLPQLSGEELSLLQYPTVSRVLVLEQVVNPDSELFALRRAGFPHAVVLRAGSWGGHILQFALIALRGQS